MPPDCAYVDSPLGTRAVCTPLSPAPTGGGSGRTLSGHRPGACGGGFAHLSAKTRPRRLTVLTRRIRHCPRASATRDPVRKMDGSLGGPTVRSGCGSWHLGLVPTLWRRADRDGPALAPAIIT